MQENKVKKALDIRCTVCYIEFADGNTPPEAARGEAVSHSTRRGEITMPITITLHIFGYILTIRVKRQDRHPAR